MEFMIPSDSILPHIRVASSPNADAFARERFFNSEINSFIKFVCVFREPLNRDKREREEKQ